MIRLASFFLSIILACLAMNGCAYGIFEDERLMDTMASDNGLSSAIKRDLIKENFSGGFSISVYCYYGHVFLIGQVPVAMQQKALIIAHRHHPRSVTPHWFTKDSSPDSDFILATRLRSKLIGAKGLSSTRIDTEINSGRVVLLGVVGSNEEKKIAIRTARRLDGVVSVTSYLMLPPKAKNSNSTQNEENQTGNFYAGPPKAGQKKNNGGIESHDLPPAPKNND